MGRKLATQQIDSRGGENSMPKNLINSMPNAVSSNEQSRSIDQQNSKHSQSMYKLDPPMQSLQAYSNNNGSFPSMGGMRSAHHSQSHSAL